MVAMQLQHSLASNEKENALDTIRSMPPALQQTTQYKLSIAHYKYY